MKEKAKYAALFALSHVAWAMVIFAVFVFFWLAEGVFIATIVGVSTWICSYVYVLAKRAKEDE